MTIDQILKLESINLVEKEILLADLLKKDRSFLHAHGEFELNSSQEEAFKQRVIRRENHEPLAYILGYQEFYGRKFWVSKDVLIPRPETENLVEKALCFAQEQTGQPLSLIDVGTGSGCMAITLKLENPSLKVKATDISQEALKVAEKNAKLLHAEVEFMESNLLEKVDQKLDIIVANLPYIPTTNLEKLEPEVRDYEPRLALDSFDSKTSLYETLFSQAKMLLKPTGVIFYEIDGDIFTKNYKELT